MDKFYDSLQKFAIHKQENDAKEIHTSYHASNKVVHPQEKLEVSFNHHQWKTLIMVQKLAQLSCSVLI